MVYVSVCLDHTSFQMLGMYEPENVCVKSNGTMHRKTDSGGFWCAEK